MEEALAQAGVPPSQVDYLEAHATGSQLGDPIELNAAAAVYGDGRGGDRPLLVGSVKSNIGHVEWAAGIAALIKTVLAMNQGVIPAHLNFQNPNPHVEWDRIPLRIASDKTVWPSDSGRPALAGVNAFGLSGTNAHVLIEGYDANGSRLPSGGPQPVAASLPEPYEGFTVSGDAPVERPARLLPLSGKSAGALRDLADRYVSWLDGQEGPVSEAMLSDLAWTAGTGRSHLPHRAGLVFADAGRLRRDLLTLAAGREVPDRSVRDRAGKVAFVYAGRHDPWIAMGESLYRSEPVVRAVLDRCNELLGETPEGSMLDVVFRRSVVDQHPNGPASVPFNFALASALTALWASVGVTPSAVVGRGPGALAAAHAGGVLTLEEGLSVAASLGVLQDMRPGQDPQPALEALEEALAGITLSAPSMSLIGGADGRLMDPAGGRDADRWLRRAIEPVGFSGCVGTLARLGVDVAVDVGADSGLGRTIREAWPEAGAMPTVLTTLVGPSGSEQSPGFDEGFLSAVADAYEAGLDLSFAGLFAGEVRRRISLPGYPFQRRRHWI